MLDNSITRLVWACVFTVVLCLAPIAVQSAEAATDFGMAVRSSEQASPLAFVYDFLGKLWYSLGAEDGPEVRNHVSSSKGYTDGAASSPERGTPTEPDGADGPAEWGPYIDPDG